MVLSALALVTVTVAVILALPPVQKVIGLGGGSDDRPPIIVRDGSLIIDGGDPKDTPEIVANWRNWAKDLTSDEWKPDLALGKDVNSFTVTVTDPGSTPCATVTGGQTVVIDFSDGNKIHFRIHKKFGLLQKEPKLKSDRQPLTAHPMITGVLPPVPAWLEYGQSGQGWISAVTVDGNQTCSLKQPANQQARDLVRVNIAPVH